MIVVYTYVLYFLSIILILLILQLAILRVNCIISDEATELERLSTVVLSLIDNNVDYFILSQVRAIREQEIMMITDKKIRKERNVAIFGVLCCVITCILCIVLIFYFSYSDIM